MPQREDQALESQFDRRVTELESRFAFQEHAISELSDALAAARAEAEGNRLLLLRALGDLKNLRGLLYSSDSDSDSRSGSDPANEPPPHY